MNEQQQFRQLLKDKMHKDLSRIVNEDEPLYVLTLQQEVLACSLDHCMAYYDQFNTILFSVDTYKLLMLEGHTANSTSMTSKPKVSRKITGDKEFCCKK